MNSSGVDLFVACGRFDFVCDDERHTDWKELGLGQEGNELVGGRVSGLAGEGSDDALCMGCFLDNVQRDPREECGLPAGHCVQSKLLVSVE